MDKAQLYVIKFDQEVPGYLSEFTPQDEALGNGGFLLVMGGTPHGWMVFEGKSHLKVDENTRGTPHDLGNHQMALLFGDGFHRNSRIDEIPHSWAKPCMAIPKTRCV